MLALKIVISVILILLHIIMTSMMIILERDKPRNLIIWSFVFLFTNIVGYTIYIILRLVFYKKKKSLMIKQREDDIYRKLIEKDLSDNDISTSNYLYQFNKMAFGATLTKNNEYTIFDKYSTFISDLKKSLQNAKNTIIFEVSKVNKNDFQQIAEILTARASAGVKVKFVYDSIISPKLKKQLLKGGVKVHRFSKHNTLGRVYGNKRNLITIDGDVAYICNLNTNKRITQGKYDVADAIIKFKGDIVQEMAISSHEDAVFAGNKFIDFKHSTNDEIDNDCQMQFITNEINTDMELLIINAITLAKSSIQLQLEEFIPTESIMSLLRFAINSHIEVRLMVPLKTNYHSKYYATRAYAKELALMGANVYLYDGFIRFNSIVVDNSYVIFGSYIFDREHIGSSIQSAVIIEDSKAVDYFNQNFTQCIDNSYRISNAKYMMIRERFFKNFV